jgi:SAM-dependent methyltransferase
MFGSNFGVLRGFLSLSTVRETLQMRRSAVFAVLALTLGGCTAAPVATSRSEQPVAANPLRKPDVRYAPSPQRVVNAMLELAGVSRDDVLYDLGSGDGRIPISAARDYGARAVGIEIDPKLVALATANARKAGVADRVRFRNEDLFEADIREATVVTLFLYPDVNLKLRPKLRAELRPGTRVISHWHDMGDWQPDRTIRVEGRPLYLWKI